MSDYPACVATIDPTTYSRRQLDAFPDGLWKDPNNREVSGWFWRVSQYAYKTLVPKDECKHHVDGNPLSKSRRVCDKRKVLKRESI